MVRNELLKMLESIGLRIEVFFLLLKITEHGIRVKGTNNNAYPHEQSKTTVIFR